MQGLGITALLWSGPPSRRPYAGGRNTFWRITATGINTPAYFGPSYAAVCYYSPAKGFKNIGNRKAKVAASALYKAAKVAAQAAGHLWLTEGRPGHVQGFKEVVVDAPVNAQHPTVVELSSTGGGGVRPRSTGGRRVLRAFRAPVSSDRSLKLKGGGGSRGLWSSPRRRSRP